MEWVEQTIGGASDVRDNEPINERGSSDGWSWRWAEQAMGGMMNKSTSKMMAGAADRAMGGVSDGWGDRSSNGRGVHGRGRDDERINERNNGQSETTIASM